MIAGLLIAAALGAAAPGLTRLPVAGGGTVTVSAERVTYRLKQHRIDYTGNPVRLTRGADVLTCKRLSAQLDEAEQVKEATCEGDVRFVRADKLVTCEKAIYDEAGSRLTCEGKPELRSGPLSATGTLLVYDLARDEVTMDNVQGNVPSSDADARLKEFQARRRPKPRGEAQR